MMNLLSIFRSRGDKFYRLFEEASVNNHKAAQLLEKLCKDFKDPKKISEQVHKLEHESDQIAHEIYDELNSTFVTPLDREDIIMLTQSLDDVIDLIFASVTTITTYNIKKITPWPAKFSKVIVASTKVVADTLPKLRHRRTFTQVDRAIVEINRLENEADDLFRESMTELFKNPKNPIDVIRFRELYGLMEDVTDKTENTANVLRNLITKYA